MVTMVWAKNGARPPVQNVRRMPDFPQKCWKAAFSIPNFPTGLLRRPWSCLGSSKEKRNPQPVRIDGVCECMPVCLSMGVYVVYVCKYMRAPQCFMIGR